MTEDRISAFIRSFEQPKNEVLDQIRKEAKDAGVPVIRPETGQLLSFFTELAAPKKVLEGVSGMLEVFPGMIYQKHNILYYLI